MYSYKLNMVGVVNSWTVFLDGKRANDTFWFKNQDTFGNPKRVLLIAFGVLLPLTIVVCDIIPILLYNIDNNNNNNYDDHSFWARLSRLCFVFVSIIILGIILKQINAISDLFYFSMEIKAISVMITLTFIASLLSLIINQITPNNVIGESYYFLIDTGIFILCDFMLIYSATGYIYYKLIPRARDDHHDRHRNRNRNRNNNACENCLDAVFFRDNRRNEGFCYYCCGSPDDYNDSGARDISQSSSERRRNKYGMSDTRYPGRDSYSWSDGGSMYGVSVIIEQTVAAPVQLWDNSRLDRARGGIKDKDGYVVLNIKGKDYYNLKKLNFGCHVQAYFTHENGIHLLAS